MINVYYTDRNLLDYLLLNLAIADSSTVIFLSPKYIFSHAFSHPQGSLGDALCIAVTGGNIGWVGAVTSVFCLVAIAAERYYAVVHPIKYVARPLRKRNLKVRLLQFIAPRRDFAQKAKSRGGTLVTRAYIKESTYSWNIQSVCQKKSLFAWTGAARNW